MSCISIASVTISVARKLIGMCRGLVSRFPCETEGQDSCGLLSYLIHILWPSSTHLLNYRNKIQ